MVDLIKFLIIIVVMTVVCVLQSVEGEYHEKAVELLKLAQGRRPCVVAPIMLMLRRAAFLSLSLSLLLLLPQPTPPLPLHPPPI